MNWLRNPANRVKAAIVLFWLSLVAWPVSSVTLFRGEPQGVLGLSWLAILLTLLDIVLTADIREQQ